MPVFAYRGFDAGQRMLDGTIAADSASHARQLLREQAVLLTRMEPLAADGRAPTRGIRRGLPWRAGRRAEAVAELWRNLAVLLDAGLSLGDALGVCIRQQRGAIQPVL